MSVLINWRSLLYSCKNGKQGGHQEWASEVQKTTEEEERGKFIFKKTSASLSILHISMLAFNSATRWAY